MEFTHLSPSGRSNRQNFNNSSSNNIPTVSRNNLFQQQQYSNNSSINVHHGSLIQPHPGSQNGVSSYTNQFNFPLRSNRNFPNPYPSSRTQKVNNKSSLPTTQQVLLDNNSGKSRVRQSRGDQNHHLQNINEGSQEDNNTDESNMSSTTSPPCPVYRIFKRGDNIPGINPLCIQTSMNNEANNSSSISSSSQNMQLENRNDSSSSSLLSLDLINQHAEGVVSSNSSSSLSSTNNNIHTSLESSDSGCASSTTCSTSELNSQQSTTKSNRTPISIIGDIARFHGLTAEYRLTNETGPPHAPTFTVVLVLGNEQYQAQGSSIKKAQLSAASMAVEKTALTRPPSRVQPKKSYNQSGFHPKRTNWTIMQLNALAEELNEKLSFTSQPVFFEMNPFGKNDPPSLVVVHVGEKVFTGEGVNFNAAKNQAAVSALKALMEMKRERELLKMAESGNLPDAEIDLDGKSPISICHEMALKRGLHVSFEVKGEEGPPHLKVFTVQCIVGDSLSTDGTGPTKQQAKKSSCELMIAKLRDIPLKLPKSTISLKAMQKGLLKSKVTRKKPSTPVVKEIDKQIVSPISRLLQIAHVKKYREPEFSIVSKPNEGDGAEQSIGGKNTHRNKKKKPIFTMEVKIGPHVCQGTGPNKKAAKKNAADAALLELGYTPTADSTLTNNSNGSANIDSDTVNATNDTTTKTASTKENESNYKMNSPLTAYRQIVPGLLVIKSSGETNGQVNSSTTPAHVAQEMIKMNSMSVPPTSNPKSNKSFDGIGKLSYLAELLEVSVSYSDFPKKNEFLSVVSIGTNPPHVGHGIGPTREEAQNSAALGILEELATTGLDNVAPSALSSSSDCTRVPIPSD